jgi:hypothetical protein
MDLPKQIIRVLCHFEGAKSLKSMGMGEGVAGRSNSGPRRANRGSSLASDGTAKRETVPELPSGAQSSQMVE